MLIPRQPPPKSHSPVMKSNVRGTSNDLNPYQFSHSPGSLPRMTSKYKIPTYQNSSIRVDSLESQFSSIPSHGHKASSYISSMSMIKDEIKQPSPNGGGTYRGTLNTQISTYEQGYKMLSGMHANTGNKDEIRPSVRKNKPVQKRDITDSPPSEARESVRANKSHLLKATALNTLVKNTKASFDKHGTGMAPLDEARLKKLNMTSIREFSDKYTLRYLQGYSNQLLEKCISLLSTENDPFVLENMFPGQYTMYIAIDPTISSLEANKANTKITSSTSHEHFDSLNNPLQSPTSNGGFLPTIRAKRLENLHIETDSQGPASRSSIYNSSRFSGMSVIGSKKYKTLPKMDIETFKETLYFYKDFAHKSVLLVIEATYKEAVMQVGFVELLWDESKQGSICISKYFIQKVYRKMGMMIPVTVKALDHLFKTYKVDRLSMEMLPGNDALHDPLTLAGFKYEKMFYRNQQKWQNYVLKKKEFYQCFHDIVGLPENFTLETTFRSVPRMW